MSEKKIYFAHPLSDYPDDNQWIAHISSHFAVPNDEIENPNKPVHQEGFAKRQFETGDGMTYFFDLIKEIPIGVFLAFIDLKIGTGVWREMDYMRQQGATIFEISRTDRTVSRIDVLDKARRLTIPETIEHLKQASPGLSFN